MEVIKETDIAWVAGFFDGEGCVNVQFKLTKEQMQERAVIVDEIRALKVA